ncbi:transketolase family protein [Anaerolentibacter hominis]|uniref:transketolase family protein n=1 Tax=Anaerolentibacter hominis TaxID=3079009 RepID=UPI0031B8B198
MADLKKGDMIDARSLAGGCMVDLGDKNSKLVVLNADLSRITFANEFIKKYPERSFNVGIAEQNLISVAAGLAHEGFMPVAYTMAPFLTMRACEQIRTDVCYGQLPVRMIGSGSGYSMGISGATHSALEDVAITTSMAGMTVLEPGDAKQVVKMLEASMDYAGPIYIRVSREPMRVIYDDNYDYQIGKAITAREGDDAAFIVSGNVVASALDAAVKLKADCGVNVRVVDMHTIKPLDVDAVLSAAKTGNVIAAQDHNIIGGLGYHVGAALAQAGVACNFKILGCPDKFVPLATPQYLYKINEYDTDGLYKNMKEMLGK